MIPELPNHTILLVEVGSTAHGTGIPGGEDRDETAVFVESEYQVLGLGEGARNQMYRTQPEGVRSGPGDTDRQVYPLRNFLRLAAQGNPSILMTFWAPIVTSTWEGDTLQGLGPMFISRNIIPRYRGYMKAQAERLLGVRGSGGHGRRGKGGREELIEVHGFDTKYAMHCSRLGFQCQELLLTRHLNLPILGEPGEWLRGLRRGEVPFDEWWDRTLFLDQQLAAYAGNESIPQEPDKAAIEKWSIAVHTDLWGYM